MNLATKTIISYLQKQQENMVTDSEIFHCCHRHCQPQNLVKIWNCLFISTVALHRVHNEKNWPGSLVTTASMVSYLRPAGPCYLWRTLTGHWSDVCTGIHQTTTNLPFPNLILALSQCPVKFISNHSCISGDSGFLYHVLIQTIVQEPAISSQFLDNLRNFQNFTWSLFREEQVYLFLWQSDNFRPYKYTIKC